MCVWWNFESVIHWEFIPNGSTVDANFKQLERVHEILKRRYPAIVNGNRVLLQQNNARPTCCMNYGKNSGIGRNRTATTPSIQPWSCVFRLPCVSIHDPFLAWKKFRKHRSCGSGSYRILRIKNQRLVPSRDNKPRWKMAQDHRIWWSLLWTVV